MKGRIDKFDNELDKRLDDTNFADDVRAGFYIVSVDESDGAAHGDGYNIPSDE